MPARTRWPWSPLTSLSREESDDLGEAGQQVFLGVEEDVEHARGLAGAVAEQRAVKLGVDLAQEAGDLPDQRLGNGTLVLLEHALDLVEPLVYLADVGSLREQPAAPHGVLG